MVTEGHQFVCYQQKRAQKVGVFGLSATISLSPQPDITIYHTLTLWSYMLYHRELDEKMDTTVMSV